MRLAALLLFSAALVFAQETASPAEQSDADPGTVVVPAGTKLPVVLKHGINTKTARSGDPIYCETNFPVVANNRILIPAGTYVQGSISNIKRPGRVKGRAEVLMHFDTLIFPNGYTVAIPGAVDNLPGADTQQLKDKEGTIQADSSKGKDAATIAGTGATGAVIGSVAAGGKGAGIGAAAGGLAGLAITMLTRGNEVRLDPGTTVEMVLQRPLVLEEERLAALPDPLVPAGRQNRPMERPKPTTPPRTK
ncbi:MAG: TrbI/VirB10 family protein [Acidobacteriia bacterium]|nr:TrbI/VirB10 family protein [Terriglobia bacterium]